MSPKASVPVVDSLGRYLYRVPLKIAAQYVREDRVREISWEGTRAVMATAEHLEYLRTVAPPVGTRWTHRRETGDNPRGVWTFKKHCDAATQEAQSSQPQARVPGRVPRDAAA